MAGKLSLTTSRRYQLPMVSLAGPLANDKEDLDTHISFEPKGKISKSAASGQTEAKEGSLPGSVLRQCDLGGSRSVSSEASAEDVAVAPGYHLENGERLPRWCAACILLARQHKLTHQVIILCIDSECESKLHALAHFLNMENGKKRHRHSKDGGHS
jgi:hypothetical protein